MKSATDKLKEKMENSRNLSLKALAKECVALVVKEGADYKVKGSDYEITSKYYTGNTLFHYLIKFYSEDASIFEEIEVLLNKYPDNINILNGRNMTPLQTLMDLFSYGSITLDNFKRLSLFLANKGADLKVLSTSSSVAPATLLHFYIETNVNGINNAEIAAILKKGPKELVHIKDANKETALNALLNQRYKLSQQDFNKNMLILVRADSDFSIRDHNQDGNTLLHHLIKTSNKSSNYDEIETLLNHDPKLIHVLNGWKETPLQYLMNSFIYKNLSLEEFKKLSLLLANKGAKLKELSTSTSIAPTTVLHLLVKTGLNGENDDAIAKLVAMDSTLINLPNGKNDTPVQAILNDKAQVSPEFLKKMKNWGADLLCKTSIDATLLHLACHSGNLNVAKYLVSEGLDLFAKIKTGQGMLHYCFENHNEELWQWLIDNRLDINAQDTLTQYTPLHYAINNVNFDFAKWLIAHDARTDLSDSQGITALSGFESLFGVHHASSQNNTEITKNTKPVNKAKTQEASRTKGEETPKTAAHSKSITPASSTTFKSLKGTTRQAEIVVHHTEKEVHSAREEVPPAQEKAPKARADTRKSAAQFNAITTPLPINAGAPAVTKSYDNKKNADDEKVRQAQEEARKAREEADQTASQFKATTSPSFSKTSQSSGVTKSSYVSNTEALGINETNPTQHSQITQKAQESKKQTIVQLMTLCEKYLAHLNNQKKPNSILLGKKIIVSKLIEQLTNSKTNDHQKIADFESVLTPENKEQLSKRYDSNSGMRFLEAIVHILTLGIYSNYTKGTFKFWKAHGEAFKDEAEEIIVEKKNNPGKKI